MGLIWQGRIRTQLPHSVQITSIADRCPNGSRAIALVPLVGATSRCLGPNLSFLRGEGGWYVQYGVSSEGGVQICKVSTVCCVKSLLSTAHSVGSVSVDKEQKEGEEVDGLTSGEKGDHVGLRRKWKQHEWKEQDWEGMELTLRRKWRRWSVCKYGKTEKELLQKEEIQMVLLVGRAAGQHGFPFWRPWACIGQRYVGWETWAASADAGAMGPGHSGQWCFPCAWGR